MMFGHFWQICVVKVDETISQNTSDGTSNENVQKCDITFALSMRFLHVKSVDKVCQILDYSELHWNLPRIW